MAKTRSGLGRGLNSLLGKSNELTNQPFDEIASEPEGAEEEKAIPTSPTPSVSVEVKEEEVVEEVEIKEESVIVAEKSVEIAEDHVTIKGVMERDIQKKVEEEPKISEKEADEVNIEDVIPNPDQPRTNFKKEELEELAESIKKNGLLQPILVRRVEGGKYQIIAGERRWQACKTIGMTTVPVRIKDVEEADTVVLALIENIQRSDLNPIEEAYGYRRMMERGGMTQSEVAQAVSKGRSTIANALRLLELPEEAQQLLFEEKITAGHARAILSIPTVEGRRKLTDKLIDEQLSVRETEAIARLLSGKKDKKGEKKAPAPKSYRTVARTLQEALGTSVKVKSSKGKNKIEIEFKDEADLERLFRMITS